MERKYERAAYWVMVEKLRPEPNRKIARGWKGFVMLRIKRVTAKGTEGNSWTVVVYVHHGYGGGRLEGGHALTLGRIFKNFDCDVALLGHRHTSQPIRQVQLRPNKKGTRIEERHQVATFTGGYLRGYVEGGTYAEEKGLPPKPVGGPEILLIPKTREIKVLT